MPRGRPLDHRDGERPSLDDTYARGARGRGPGGATSCFAVSDTGTGMDAETQARRVSSRFPSPTKEKGKGTGLGAWPPFYGIVKQSGGYIWVYSEPGPRHEHEGCILPRRRGADRAPSAPHSSRVGLVARLRGRILVVEDQDEVRKLTRRMLEARGYPRAGGLRAGADALGLSGAANRQLSRSTCC